MIGLKVCGRMRCSGLKFRWACYSAICLDRL